MFGASQNQKKKLKKQQAQAATGSASETKAPEVTAMEGKKTETVKVDAAGKKTVSISTEAEVTASDNTKAKAKKASKKTTLPSGLVLEDVKNGAGAAAKKGQKVSMRYIGKLQNGTIFDSKSVWMIGTHLSWTLIVFLIDSTKGKAFEFKLGAGQVIKGWDEGVCAILTLRCRR